MFFMFLHGDWRPGVRQDEFAAVVFERCRSMQLALNGSYGWGKQSKGSVTTVEIKKGARWQVEGVKEVK